jgi:hypothetical protein
MGFTSPKMTDLGKFAEFYPKYLSQYNRRCLNSHAAILNLFPSYVCHLIEEVYKFGESQLEPHLESSMNMQASHNEGVNQTLTDIRATLAEVTVIQSEEKDGRLNERYKSELFRS